MAERSRFSESAYWAMKIGLGATAFLAGADKFTDRMVDWEKYLSPAAKRMLPVSGSTFMKMVGIIEMGVGGLILGRETRLGSYIASAWLLGIAANLVMDQDYYDIAARDVNMAIGAYTLGRMAEARTAQHRSRQATWQGTSRRAPEPAKLSRAPSDLRDEAA